MIQLYDADVRLPRYIPEPPLNNFIEKQNLFEEIEKQFYFASKEKRIIICGSPGVGKSTQAMHYAHRFRGIVRWISADTELKVDNGFREIARNTKNSRCT